MAKFFAGALLGAWLATAAVGSAEFVGGDHDALTRIVRALERIASAAERCK